MYDHVQMSTNAVKSGSILAEDIWGSLWAPRVYDVCDDAGRFRASDLHLASASPWWLGLCLGLLAVGIRQSRRIVRYRHITATSPTVSSRRRSAR